MIKIAVSTELKKLFTNEKKTFLFSAPVQNKDCNKNNASELLGYYRNKSRLSLASRMIDMSVVQRLLFLLTEKRGQ